MTDAAGVRSRATSIALPIFPLNTVLFPGGLLPLRVFEARYMDMVRRAMREGSEFGVCLITAGNEVGTEGVETEAVGCRARIDDWNMEQMGVLEIATTGTERFRIIDRTVQSDGLLVADVEPIAPDAAMPLPASAAPLAALLERIIAQWDDTTDADRIVRPIAKPYRFDDATWVGNRLSEVLPAPLPVKQMLMATTDATVRLDGVREFLQLQGIV